MHTIALQLAPLLAAEKSKVPFYIAGGLLVAWALFVSLGLGMRNPNFPSSLGQQRAIMAVTLVLVVFAVSMAVVTSGGDTKAKAAPAPTSSTEASTGAAATSSTAAPESSTSSSTSTTGKPTATTGTPTPSSSPAAPAATKLALAAEPGGQLAYDTSKLSAKAGAVTITMTNMSPVEHNLTIAQGSKVLGATPTFVGGTKSVTVTLKPGTYSFYCSVPGHRQAGMEGTLTVS